MKGFKLQVNEKFISGATDEGITSIIITCKENLCHVNFGSLDKTGMYSYTWYASDLRLNDCLNISFEDIVALSEITETRDYNKSLEESQKEDLEIYLKLRLWYCSRWKVCSC